MWNWFTSFFYSETTVIVEKIDIVTEPALTLRFSSPQPVTKLESTPSWRWQPSSRLETRYYQGYGGRTYSTVTTVPCMEYKPIANNQLVTRYESSPILTWELVETIKIRSKDHEFKIHTVKNESDFLPYFMGMNNKLVMKSLLGAKYCYINNRWYWITATPSSLYNREFIGLGVILAASILSIYHGVQRLLD